ncbi:MAG: hypothetical protein WDZ59_11780 [Pirellulales bacterium]
MLTTNHSLGQPSPGAAIVQDLHRRTLERLSNDLRGCAILPGWGDDSPAQHPAHPQTWTDTAALYRIDRWHGHPWYIALTDGLTVDDFGQLSALRAADHHVAIVPRDGWLVVMLRRILTDAQLQQIIGE